MRASQYCLYECYLSRRDIFHFNLTLDCNTDVWRGGLALRLFSLGPCLGNAAQHWEEIVTIITSFLSVCLFVCLSVCLFVCLSVCLFVCLSVCLFASLSVCLFASLNVCLPVFLCVCLSLCVSVCLFFCLSVYAESLCLLHYLCPMFKLGTF
jgi:hypothetical protein